MTRFRVLIPFESTYIGIYDVEKEIERSMYVFKVNFATELRYIPRSSTRFFLLIRFLGFGFSISRKE